MGHSIQGYDIWAEIPVINDEQVKYLFNAAAELNKAGIRVRVERWDKFLRFHIDLKP